MLVATAFTTINRIKVTVFDKSGVFSTEGGVGSLGTVAGSCAMSFNSQPTHVILKIFALDLALRFV